MEFRLLGSVEVLAAGQPIDSGPPRQRAVLAALLVGVNEVVRWDTLVDRIWGDEPPACARDTLRAYVTRIRRLLERATDGTGHGLAQVMYQPGGYRLTVEPGRVDLHRFRHLVGEGRHPGRADEDRLTALREAMGLWHGEPLTGVSGPWAARIRETLGRERLDAMAAWARAEVCAGDPEAVLGPLGDAVRAHPEVESLVIALMRALVAAGRPADALDRCRQHRQHLSDEYGIDQAPEVRVLFSAILRGESAAASVPSTLAGSPPGDPVPVQLPADVPVFTGRTECLANLDRYLDDMTARPSTAVVVSAISGTAGVGKTTLAVHWAHRVAHRFPDGQLYVNLRGFDPRESPLAVGEAVRRFLDSLGVPARRMPLDLDGQTALYRSRLAGRRVLILLDNARDAEQVRPLLPGVPGCLVIVTSRNQLVGLAAVDGAHVVTIDLPSADEARQLFVARLAASRVAAEPDAVADIVDSCTRLPIALAVVAAHAAVNPRLTLTALAGQLRAMRGNLDVFDGGDAAADVRAVFSWSYRVLSPPAARLFRLLGLHAFAEFSTPAAASLAGRSRPETRRALGELGHANLVTELVPDRFVMHDLLREYAAELALTHDPDHERTAAMRRFLDHLLHAAHAAAVRYQPHALTIEPTPCAPGVVGEEQPDRATAYAWFTAERASVMAAVRYAVANGWDTHVWQLAWASAAFLQHAGHWADWAESQQLAVQAAERLGDRRAQAHAYCQLGAARFETGHRVDADRHFRRALELFTALNDRSGQASAHRGLSANLGLQGRMAKAGEHLATCLALYETIGDRHGQALTLNNWGWGQVELGSHRLAIELCSRALRLLRGLDEPQVEAVVWDTLGLANQHLHRHRAAVTCYQAALQRFDEAGDQFHAAVTRDHLGDSHRAAGQLEQARHAWRQALDMFERLHHPDRSILRVKLADLTDSRRQSSHADSAAR